MKGIEQMGHIHTAVLILPEEAKGVFLRNARFELISKSPDLSTRVLDSMNEKTENGITILSWVNAANWYNGDAPGRVVLRALRSLNEEGYPFEYLSIVKGDINGEETSFVLGAGSEEHGLREDMPLTLEYSLDKFEVFTIPRK